MAEQKTLTMYVSPDRIELTGLNPRKEFDPQRMAELATSVKENGIVEPLVVRPKGKGYELVAGERRLRAAGMVGLDKVPVVVREVKDEQIVELMLLENLAREDLKPLEEGGAIVQLIERGMTQEEIARRIGRSQAFVSGRARLLKLPERLREHLQKGNVSIEQALMVVPYADWPAAEGMSEQIDKQLQRGRYGKEDHIDEHTYDQTLDEVFRSARYFLSLNPGEYEANHEAMKHFDRDGCKGCAAPMTLQRYGNKRKYCPNAKCFRPRLAAARKVIKEKEGKVDAQAVKKGDPLDLARKASSSYRVLSSHGVFKGPTFELSSCEEKCEYKAKAELHGNKVVACLEPKCFDSKERAAVEKARLYREERLTLARQNAERMVEKGKEFTDKELRYLVGMIYNETDYGRNPLKPWIKKKPGDEKKLRLCTQGIPSGDLRKALLGMAISEDLADAENDEDYLEVLGTFFPELLQGTLSAHAGAKVRRQVKKAVAKEFDGDGDPVDDEGAWEKELGTEDLEGVEPCEAMRRSKANGGLYCGLDGAGSYCIYNPGASGSAFECPKGRPRVHPEKDAPGLEADGGEYDDPDAEEI